MQPQPKQNHVNENFEEPDETRPEQVRFNFGLDDITPYKKIPEKYPNLFTPEAWAWKVKRRKHNGLGRAFRKIGKDLFVIDPILNECINEQVED